jgi:hypothetical protein
VSKSTTLSLMAMGSLLLAAGCAGPSYEAPAMTFADAKAEAAERNVPLLIDFYTDW